MPLLLKLLHVLAAIVLFCGVAGRWVTFQRARRSGQLHAVLGLLEASEVFERRMVIPASMVVLVFGLAAALYSGWPLFGFLQGARDNWLLVSLVLYVVGLPAVPLYLIPARRRRAAAMQAALAAGSMTAELRAALTDRGVIGFRIAEMAGLVVITVLMVTKPF
jgi:uncharacterized membrane protein